MPTDVNEWTEFNWHNDTITYEGSWSGSPPVDAPAIPLLNPEELHKVFLTAKTRNESGSRSRGGRPVQHDWDAFWVELCRRVHDQGVPETQGELVDAMFDWFLANGHENIDQRTIEKKIAKLFSALRPE